MIYTKIVKIGNSQGVRLPKSLLEISGIQEQICLSSENGKIVITPVQKNRQGWAESFQMMAENEDDHPLDSIENMTSTWDEQEWEW
jgi:antitoxin MazE